jgi:hypothetical protein
MPSVCDATQVRRQKLPGDWNKRLQAISTKANEAIKEVAPELLRELKGGADAPLDYFRAVEIRDKLAATCDRTLFGGLTGKAAEWDKIVKAYEKSGGGRAGGRSSSRDADSLCVVSMHGPHSHTHPPAPTHPLPHDHGPTRRPGARLTWPPAQRCTSARRRRQWCRTPTTRCRTCESRRYG